MSSYTQTSEENLVEQTRRQIQSLVAEIAGLARQNMAPGQFYEQFLNRLVSAMAALGGVVWTTGENNQLALQYQVNLQQTGLLENEEKQQQHGRLLYKVLTNPDVAGGNGLLVPPHSGFGGDEAANATNSLLVFGPLRTDLEMVGLIEIFQRPDAPPQVQQGYLRFLLEMCALAGDFLKSHQLRHFSDRQVLWARLEDFTHGVHSSLVPLETAYTIANEARRLIECDRVSVAIRKGNRCTIEAVSGQDVFDKRSNTVRLLGRLATAVVATGEPVWYAGDTRDLAPQVEDAVQEYVDEAHSKMIAVLPLGRPKPDQDADDEEKDNIEEPVGALIVEQIEDNRVAPAMAQRIEVVCRHSSVALANAIEHQSLFLMPVWRAIGKSKFVVQARTLPKTVAIVIALVAVILCLFLLPWDFDLHAKGTLEPVDRRDVFADVDGTVSFTDDNGKFYFKDANGEPSEIGQGTHVKQDQLLLRLRNPTIEQKKLEIDSQMGTETEHFNALEHELTVNGPTMKEIDRAQLVGQEAESKAKLAGLRDQAAVVKTQLDALDVKSPIDGQIVTWDLKNRLDNRPVQRGQSLLRVAKTGGPWELDLNMAEDRMGHIARAEKLVKDTKEANLPVTYILATAPGTSHQGTVKEMSLVANPEKEEGNIVVMRVSIDKSDIRAEDIRAGAAVSGKVYCGRRSLGYVWFHDVFAFIQTKILFRFF